MILIGACTRSVLWVVDFDRYLGDEKPKQNIDQTYLCGQKLFRWYVYVKKTHGRFIQTIFFINTYIL